MKWMLVLKKKAPKTFKNWGRYLFGLSALDHQSLATNGLQKTIAHLQKSYRFYMPALARATIQFYNYLYGLENAITDYKKEGLLIIHFCCWGKAYTEKMLYYFLPSLLAKNNLPKVAESQPVLLLIHCDAPTKMEILNSPVAKELFNYAELQFIDLPTELLSVYHHKPHFLEAYFLKKFHLHDHYKYLLLGGIQTHALKVAIRNKACISFMMPDIILSEAFFSEILRVMPEKKAVVKTTYRTNYRKISDHVLPFYNNEKTQLTVSAEKLTELQAEMIHESAKRRIVSESTLGFAPCAQLLFEAEQGVIIRSFHYHPILLNCALLSTPIQMDYFPIDNSVLNQIMSQTVAYEQQVVVCNDNTKASWVEISDEDVEPDTTTGRKIAYTDLIASIKMMLLNHPATYNTPLNRYFFSFKNEVYSRHLNQKVPIQEAQYFTDISKCLTTL